MASFPTFNLSNDQFKIRFREQYASEVLNQRFMGTPLGVYLGLMPVVSGSVVTLIRNVLNGVSLLRGVSTASKTALDAFFEVDIPLDFTGHDFVASGPVYVVAEISYVKNGTTSARIFTQTGLGNGRTTITICRLTGTAAPGTITAFTTDEVDRNTPFATNSKPFGFMPGGSVESLNKLISERYTYHPTILIGPGTFPLIADGRVYRLNGSGGIPFRGQLPAASTLEDGAVVRLQVDVAHPTNGILLLTNDLIFEPGSGEDGALNIPFRERATFVEVTLDKTSPASSNPIWKVTSWMRPPYHRFSHGLGGDDAIKLDNLDVPDDNTDLDASAARHGLLPKLSGSPTEVLRMDGTQGPTPPTTVLIYHPVVLSGAGPHNLVADGRIYRIDFSGGTPTLQFPIASGEPDGSIVRLQCHVFTPLVGLFLTANAADLIQYNNATENALLGDTGASLAWNPDTELDSLTLILDRSASAPSKWKAFANNRTIRREITNRVLGAAVESLLVVGLKPPLFVVPPNKIAVLTGIYFRVVNNGGLLVPASVSMVWTNPLAGVAAPIETLNGLVTAKHIYRMLVGGVSDNGDPGQGLALSVGSAATVSGGAFSVRVVVTGFFMPIN